MAFNFDFSNLLDLGGSVLQYKLATDAAKKAAKQNEAGFTAARSDLAGFQDDYNRWREQDRADREPWRRTGANALGWLERLNTPGAVKPGQFESYVKGLPGYQFASDELGDQITARLAARGDRFSGRGAKEGVRWTNDYLLQPAMTGWMNRLQTMAGYGPQTSQAPTSGVAGAMADLATGSGSNRSDLTGANWLNNQGLSTNIMRIVNDAYTRGMV